ncbi:hypothetical protein PhCBS80983_g02814 [Powellomyces hirtus]|uniref:NADPH:adrenodoxin oxidoreductase, mitochondrial n=1 Tax=Powellomyces hirtus TaxID=109895 RepID=A0A507E550_9FUNG|nr:hypothetical protein PhCBS80983_g02814 [Powellomyces hirtus]
MYEALPVPYGLVRFGVAPDHPEVKNVIHKFASIAEDARFRFVGNVNIGRDLQFAELKPHYDAIVLSYGAQEDQHLGIPGEESIKNVFSARAFVGWYNGSPEYRNLNPDLTSSDTAVVVGQGNVALDVARTLLSPVDDIARTDITSHAVEALRKSKIKHVHLIGRRGPLQAAFTAKELREMIALPDTKLNIDLNLVHSQIKADAEALAKDRPRRRLMELLIKGATKTFSEEPSKSWTLQFLRSPVELVPHPETNALKAVLLEKNTLQGSPQSPKAVGTGQIEELSTGLLLRSIGYRSVPFRGVPFDSRKGLIPNVKGRVSDEKDSASGLYVSGWLKRGPTGVITATMYDAIETATSIVEDVQAGNLKSQVASKGSDGFESLKDLLKERGANPISFKDWESIDKAEITAGEAKGKPREKIVDVQSMLKIVAAGRAE